MAGGVDICPECGAELPSSDPRCPLCGPDQRAGRAVLDRSRKRRLAVLVIGVVIVLSAIALRPVVHELFLPPSQKLIVTAEDLGPGWGSSTPMKMTVLEANVTDTATVFLDNTEGLAYIEGHCTLMLFSDREQADRYYLEHRSEAFSDENLVSVDDPTIGDRAYTASSNTGEHDNVARYILMQKGIWIASIYLHTTGEVALGAELIMHAAEAQAAKLP